MPEPSFEKALDNLEKIVEELEEGNLTLEDTIKKFEQGVKLSRLCEKKLSAARKKVSILTRDESGELKETPLETDDGSERDEQDISANDGAGTESLFDE